MALIGLWKCMIGMLHLTEAELARDIQSVMEKVQQGLEVVVERDNQPIALLRAVAPPRRTISECIALAEQREKDRGYPVRLDPDFANDVEQIVQSRKPWKPRPERA